MSKGSEVARNSLAFQMGAMELADRRRGETALAETGGEDALAELAGKVRYGGRLVPFGEYVNVQQALAMELSARSGGRIPQDYWKSFEIVKLPDGKYRALARSEKLCEFEGVDGNPIVTKVAQFTYTGNVGLNAKRGGKYNDEHRLLTMGEDGNSPKVGETEEWASM